MTIGASATIDRVRLGQMDQLRRPLIGVRRRRADAPAVTNTPSVAATLRRFFDKVRFRKEDTRITQQFVNTMLDVPAIDYSQTINRARTELIERVGIESVLCRNAGKIAGAR